MRLIHINLQNGWRGGEQQLAYLLKSLEEKGFWQLLICLKDSPLEKLAVQENIPFISVQNNFSKIATNAKLLAKIAEEDNVEIIHCHESKGHTLAILAKLLFSCKSKIVVHRRVVFPIKGFLSTKIKYSSKYIDKVICISKAVEDLFRSSTGNTNSAVVHDMTDVHFKFENRHLLTSKYGVPTKKIIGYIAALTFEKDHYTFFDTAKILLQENEDLHFVLIGDGPLREPLEEYVLLNGLKNHVSFLGFIDNAKTLIPEIDILLFPSVKEGLGSTILDFFVAKKPVVTVKNGGSEDLISNGKNGFICDQKDSVALSKCISILLSDKAKHDKILEEAFQFVKDNFSIESITNKTIAVYQMVTTQKN